MTLVRIKPGLSHAHYSAGDEFDASPAEMESFGDKFILVVETKPVTVVEMVAMAEVDATPGARKLAEEHGVSLALSAITGTGKGSKITKADVQALLDGDGQWRITDTEVETHLVSPADPETLLNGNTE